MKPACWKNVRKTHPKCRPPSEHKPMMQLRDDHRWIRASGTPGLAFVTDEGDDTATVYVANCACADYFNCPVSRALAFAGNRYSAATVIRRRAVRKPYKQNKIRRSRKSR